MNDGDPIVVPVPGEAFAMSDEEALRLAMGHSLLRAGEYPDIHAVRQDIIIWLAFAGYADAIPTEWYRDTLWVATNSNVTIPPSVSTRQSSYNDMLIHDRLDRGESLTSIQDELMSWMTSRVNSQYSAMVHRTTDGSDPLVQEP